MVKKVCETTYLVEDLPAMWKKTKFRRFNAHVCQIRRFHAREDVEWERADYSEEEEEESSDSEEEGEVINNTREPEENLPSVAATETVGLVSFAFIHIYLFSLFIHVSFASLSYPNAIIISFENETIRPVPSDFLFLSSL